MSINFEWKKKYEVGVPELDKQHQYLFNLGNEIQYTDKSHVKPFVMKLYKYASHHFKTEEAHMKEIKYPNVKDHRILHDKLITDLNSLSGTFSTTSFDEFKSFLYTWLVNHILNEDKKYFEFAQLNKET